MTELDQIKSQLAERDATIERLQLERIEFENNGNKEYAVIPRIHHENNKEIYISQTQRIVEFRRAIADRDITIEKLEREAWQLRVDFDKQKDLTRKLANHNSDYSDAIEVLVDSITDWLAVPCMGTTQRMKEALNSEAVRKVLR